MSVSLTVMNGKLNSSSYKEYICDTEEDIFFVAKELVIGDLSNVNVSGISDGQFLAYSARWFQC